MKSGISVVIPVYNREEYIASAIRSVLAQTVLPDEILVIDDGSTDGTAAVVAGLVGPIRYLYQQNEGQAAARNRGIAMARGDFVALLDSDDRWLPEKLERQLSLLKGASNVGFVHTAARLIDEHGMCTGEVWGKPEYCGRVRDQLLFANGVNASSVMVRRALIEEVGGYDERFRALENWDLWLRLSLKCEFAFLSLPLIHYRVHSGNLVKDLDQMRRAYMLLHAKHIFEAVEPPPAHIRRRALARYHEAMADARVGQGDYGAALQDFLKSLYHRPGQPAVVYRFLRVAIADLMGQGRRDGGGAT